MRCFLIYIRLSFTFNKLNRVEMWPKLNVMIFFRFASEVFYVYRYYSIRLLNANSRHSPLVGLGGTKVLPSVLKRLWPRMIDNGCVADCCFPRSHENIRAQSKWSIELLILYITRIFISYRHQRYFFVFLSFKNDISVIIIKIFQTIDCYNC